MIKIPDGPVPYTTERLTRLERDMLARLMQPCATTLVATSGCAGDHDCGLVLTMPQQRRDLLLWLLSKEETVRKPRASFVLLAEPGERCFILVDIDTWGWTMLASIVENDEDPTDAAVRSVYQLITDISMADQVVSRLRHVLKHDTRPIHEVQERHMFVAEAPDLDTFREWVGKLRSTHGMTEGHGIVRSREMLRQRTREDSPHEQDDFVFENVREMLREYIDTLPNP